MIISLDLKHLLFSFFIRIGFKFNIKLSLAKIATFPESTNFLRGNPSNFLFFKKMPYHKRT